MLVILLPYAFMVGLAHVITGVLLFFDPLAAQLAPLSNLETSFYLAGGWRVHMLAVLLVGVGMLSIWASLRLGISRISMLVLVPQQIIVSTHIIGVLGAIWVGAYPDNYIQGRGAVYISVDQVWLLIGASAHIVEWFWLLLHEALRDE